MPDNKTDRAARKVVTGRVVSDKMEKTIVVVVEKRVHHAMYGKSVKQFTRLKAHDENNEGKTGDMVEIMETRRISTTKRWRLTKILEKAGAA